jgi:ribosomal protein S27E
MATTRYACLNCARKIVSYDGGVTPCAHKCPHGVWCKDVNSCASCRVKDDTFWAWATSNKPCKYCGKLFVGPVCPCEQADA